MTKLSQVQPASNTELTPDEKGEIVGMASLSNLAYLKEDQMTKLLEKRTEHENCTVFNCKVFAAKSMENPELEPEEMKHFCCEGVLQSVSKVRFFEGKDEQKKTTGAACYGGEYNGNTFISFRGTEDITDWKANLKDNRVDYWSPLKGVLKLHGKKEPDNDNCQIHEGFRGQFTNLVDQLSKYLVELKQRPSNLYLTGHSLGGALASVSSLFFSHLLPKCNIRIITFGAPRSVTDGYVKALNERRNVIASFRFQADYDIVPIKNYEILRHINGGGKRKDNTIPPGEFTIRYKRIKWTNDDKEKNDSKHYRKLFWWGTFDYGSSLLFHSQDTYQDKIAHAWSSIEGKECETWKNLALRDAPKSVKFVSFINSLINVSAAYVTCHIAMLIAEDFLYYDESFTSAQPEFSLCVRPVYDPNNFADPIDDYYSNDDGGYGGYGDLDPNLYWQELNLSQPSGYCESTPGYKYWGVEIIHGRCPRDYTCYTDYERIGYTWMADAEYKMPYCIHNNVTCGKLKYCARYVALNDRPCHPENKPCNETPPPDLLVAIVAILFMAFLCTLLIATGNIMSLFPKSFSCVVNCCRKKKALRKTEIKQIFEKWLRILQTFDALLKLFLFFQIVVFKVLDFLDNFIRAECLSDYGMELFFEVESEALYILYLVETLVVFKFLSILASAIKFYIEPPNYSEKGWCSPVIKTICKKEKGIHWRWA